jgi:hypothetical protein
MDHFENILATLLEAEGFWVRRSFKINLTKEEKALLGKPSLPRPEIDLLAYRGIDNRVLVLEAKSYFDSQGVMLKHLMEEHDVSSGRYKLFTSEKFRTVLLNRLELQLLECGMVRPGVTMKIGLAAGRVHRGQSDAVREYAESKGWDFWSPEEIREKVTALAVRGYENDAAILTAKILMRH